MQRQNRWRLSSHSPFVSRLPATVGIDFVVCCPLLVAVYLPLVCSRSRVRRDSFLPSIVDLSGVPSIRVGCGVPPIRAGGVPSYASDRRPPSSSRSVSMALIVVMAARRGVGRGGKISQ